MAYIDKNDTKIEINDAIRGNSVSNLAPSKVNDSVQLVCNVNPKDYRRCNIVRRASNNATIYTAPTDKDFYLCGTHISGTSSAVSNNGIQIAIVPKGDATVIINRITQTPTAVTDALTSVSNQDFSFPILLERGSTIAVTFTTMVAGNVSIYGYTVEN